jgi:hypothetical protein
MLPHVEKEEEDEEEEDFIQCNFSNVALGKSIDGILEGILVIGRFTNPFFFVLEEGEDDEAGLKRVIQEEMNLSLKNVKSLLGETEYVANHPEKGKHRKQVRYYLVEADYGDIKLPEGKGGLDAAQVATKLETLGIQVLAD